jgi:hypothetical protein
MQVSIRVANSWQNFSASRVAKIGRCDEKYSPSEIWFLGIFAKNNSDKIGRMFFSLWIFFGAFLVMRPNFWLDGNSCHHKYQMPIQFLVLLQQGNTVFENWFKEKGGVVL